MEPNEVSTPVVNVVIGTAGHIDHGKSSLVHRLTGIHPSRLKEEQERGMTIDIGFAEWKVSETVTAGIIDVPGHEKFIRNMVAGAAGVDLALLIIAADDGIMPQTREHVQIMRLLGIERGVIVLTKIDMVERDYADLMVEECREYLLGTFLEIAPLVRVSNVTGEGFPELESVLRDEISRVTSKSESGVFRMPVNRSFSVQGHGTVVTGIPVSGHIEVGEIVEVLPRGVEVRLRGIQVHHQDARVARAGHRAALNIADLNYREIKRGDVVALPGYFSSATLLEARFEYLDHHEAPLENNEAVTVHLGTAEVTGRLILLDRKVLLPGEYGLVQLRLDEAVVVAAKDRYIVRRTSPALTLGGGTIVGETRWRLKRFKEWLNDNLARKEAHIHDHQGYLEYCIRSGGTKLQDVEDVARALKATPLELATDLEALRSAGKIASIGRTWIHSDMLDKAADDVSAAILELHGHERLQAGFFMQQIANAAKLDAAVVEAAIGLLLSRRKVEALPDKRVRHREFKGGLSQDDSRLLVIIEEMHRKDLFGAPILSEVVAAVDRPVKKVKEILGYLQQLGRVIPVGEDLCLHIEAIRLAETRLLDRLKAGPMPSAEFKDIIQATRKYVIPLLEFFDKRGLTKRAGNERHLAPNWEKFVLLAPEKV